MIINNKALDSTVSCLGIKGIYLIILALCALMELGLVFLFLTLNMPLLITLVTVCGTTSAVVAYLLYASKNGKSFDKMRSKRQMTFYIINK